MFASESYYLWQRHFIQLFPVTLLLIQMKMPQGARLAVSGELSSIYEGAQNRKSCRHSITAAVAVTRPVSAIPLEKITEIFCFGVRGSSQQRFNVKDFLQCFQCGAMVVANGIAEGLLTAALGKR